jgi:hypothetical protein
MEDFFDFNSRLPSSLPFSPREKGIISLSLGERARVRERASRITGWLGNQRPHLVTEIFLIK